MVNAEPAANKPKDRRKTNRTQRQTIVKPFSKSIHDTASQHTESVILEFGSALIRIGIAGESIPRHVIPHNLFDIKRCSDNFYLTGEPQNWKKKILPFLTDLYTKQLLLKPKSRRVILLMGSTYQYPTCFCTALESILLHDLSIPSLLIVDQFRTIIPYALGHTQKMGIILDIGKLESRIGCVFEETCLVDTLNIIPCGFEALAQMVMDKCRDEMQLEVKSIYDGIAIVQSCVRSSNSNGTTICHLPHLNKHVEIETWILEECIQEMYFDLCNPNSLVHAFFKSLLACPLDLRKDVVRNVVFVGGSILGIPFLEQRFLACIRGLFLELAEDDRNDGERRRYKLRRPEHAKFQHLATVVMDTPLSITYPLPFSPSTIAWVGGSIMGSLNLSKEKWVHRADF